ncbi:hypothetical protein C8J56DRAFT_168367 [Mycena floridula]|nr:hypothetical protein C8J56DRAFT_168367 [Mycena floridula]
MQCPQCRHSGPFTVDEYVSPIPTYILETNNVPFTSDIRPVKALLAGGTFEQDLDTIDASITHIEGILATLRLKRGKIEHSWTAAKGALSAFRRIPAEIVGEIVRHVLDDPVSADSDTLVTKGVSLDTRSGIWAFSQVNALWRREIISCPSLWSAIDILHSKREDSIYSIAQCTRMLETIFSRAGTHALTLRLRFYSESKLATQILALCMAKYQFVADLSLVLSPGLALWMESFKPPKPLPSAWSLLRSVEIQQIMGDRYARRASPPRCFRYAPVLRRLTFANVAAIDQMKTPWEQITHFSSNGSLHMEYDLPLLAKMPNLVSLEICGNVPRALPVMNPFHSSVTLSFLKTLCIKDHQKPHRAILEGLTLPSLTEIHVHLGDLGSTLPLLSEIIYRSDCKVSHVQFYGNLEGSADCKKAVKRFLAGIPSAMTLDLGRTQGNILDILPKVLPLLNRLVLPGEPLRNSSQPFLDMMKGRRGPGFPGIATVEFMVGELTVQDENNMGKLKERFGAENTVFSIATST